SAEVSCQRLAPIRSLIGNGTAATAGADTVGSARTPSWSPPARYPMARQTPGTIHRPLPRPIARLPAINVRGVYHRREIGELNLRDAEENKECNLLLCVF